MRALLKRAASRGLAAVGLQRVAATDNPGQVSAEVAATVRAVAPYTMTSAARVAALCEAVEYVVRNRIPGDIVECGVWKGGSMMAVAQTLLRLGERKRGLWLFDTFEGMTPPTEKDIAVTGESAAGLMEKESRGDPRSVWCVASIDQVKQAVLGTGYDQDCVHFVAGRVEETIPTHGPPNIALLRLDTDWYESTRHELENFYPRLVPGGVLIIDDYGHWTGARAAVDEYLENNGIPLLLQRIDYTGRSAIKWRA